MIQLSVNELRQRIAKEIAAALQKLTYSYITNSGPTAQTQEDGRPGLWDRCRCYRHCGTKSRSPGIVGFDLKTFASSYLSEKGKNLATKEDIEDITRRVEEIKSELQARHTLRFAALDKRLQAHQEAFTRVVSLASTFYSGKDVILDAIRQCRIWYAENALFLDAQAKTAFDSAFKAAQQQSWRHAKEGYKLPTEEENYQKILAALDEITDTVGLPPLKGDLTTVLGSGTKEDDMSQSS